MHFLQPLAIANTLARINLVSEPPGAQVYQNGQLLAGVVTPTEVLVEAGKPQRFMLSLPRHVPALIEPFVPARGSTGVTKSGKLVPGTPLKTESAPDATVNTTPTAHCKALATPATCVVPAGKYTIEVLAQGGRAVRPVTVATKDLAERFELGIVEAAP